jgi:hypothetical protein
MEFLLEKFARKFIFILIRYILVTFHNNNNIYNNNL